MTSLTAIQGIASANEKSEKPTFQSTYYAEKQSDFEKARHDFINNPDLVVEYLSAEIAFDTTKLQYDETGAFISASNQELMSKTFFGEKDLQINSKTGEIAIEDKDKDQILYGATLPSLAIINSREGHDGGNKALQQVTKILERSGSVNTNPAIFHMAGADFRAAVKLRSKDDAARFEHDVVTHTWPQVPGTKETPFLVLEKVTLSESLEAFNRLQTLRAIFSPEQVLTHEEDIEREVLKISSDILTYKIEYARGLQLCNHFWEKYSSAPAEDSEYYENYFNAYLKSYFQPMGINTLEEMRTLVSVNPIIAFEEAAFRRAETTINQEDIIRKAAIKNFVASKKQNAFNGHEYSERREAIEAQSAFDFDITILEQTAREQDNTFEYERKADKQTHLNLREPKETDTQAYKEFYESWQMTQKLIEDLQAPNALTQDNFDMLIELAGLNDEIVIGETRYSIAEELSKVLLKNPSTQKTKAFSELIEDRYKNLFMKIDALTGVPNRESFYRETSEKVYQHLFEGKKTTLAFIDLAFLNYFNKLAGRETGDQAIIQSVSQLEELRLDVAKRTGDVLDIYRYAGDEEILRGIDSSTAIDKGIETINAQQRTVPLMDKTAPNYIPAPIQYNYGIADIYMAEECMENMLRAEATASGIFMNADAAIYAQAVEARKPHRMVDTIFNFDHERYGSDKEYAAALRNDLSEFGSLLADRIPNNQLSEIINSMNNSGTWASTAEISRAFELMQPIINNELSAEINSLVYENLTALPQESVRRYAEKLTRIMTLISDAFVDTQKAHSRFDFLYQKYAKLTPEDLSQQTADEYMLLQYLITFSGKSLRGLSFAAITEIKYMHEQDPSKTPWEYYLSMVEEEGNSTAQPQNLRSQIIARVASRQ
jgi:GGDEF domain-containing protein